MIHRNALLTLGLLVAAPLVAREKMTVNTMDSKITVTYRFDKANPIVFDIPGYAADVRDVPSDARVISAEIFRPSNILNKRYTFSIADDVSYEPSLNSSILIFKNDNNPLHLTRAFAMMTEEQIRDEQKRKEHLKHLPRDIYEKVAKFFSGLK